MPIQQCSFFGRINIRTEYIDLHSDGTLPNSTLILARHEITADERFYHHHDALKNVMSLSDAAGTLRANYGYAPFGGITLRAGDKSQQNAYRFSSEYADEELALVYYNYRHLNPLEGRWISRDPIAEKGGWNLMEFVGNSPVDKADKLGAWWRLGCCCACLALGIWNMYDNYSSKACVGETGKDWVLCQLSNIILSYLNANQATELLACLARAGTDKDRISDCLSSCAGGALRSLATAATCFCCLGPQISLRVSAGLTSRRIPVPA